MPKEYDQRKHTQFVGPLRMIWCRSEEQVMFRLVLEQAMLPESALFLTLPYKPPTCLSRVRWRAHRLRCHSLLWLSLRSSLD